MIWQIIKTVVFISVMVVGIEYFKFWWMCAKKDEPWVDK